MSSAATASNADYNRVLEGLHDIFPDASTYKRDHVWASIACAIILSFGKLTKPLLKGVLIQLAACVEQVAPANEPECLFWREVEAFRVLRESLLKAGALVGFPRVINACSWFQQAVEAHWPDIWAELKKDTSIRANQPREDREARGRSFFNLVYGKKAASVRAALDKGSGGDLGLFAVDSVYADLVSELSILGGKETELLQFACCLALRDCGPQAKGHMHGAKTLGNSQIEIDCAVQLIATLGERLGVPFNTRDYEWL